MPALVFAIGIGGAASQTVGRLVDSDWLLLQFSTREKYFYRFQLQFQNIFS